MNLTDRETALETGTAPTRYWHALEDAEQITDTTLDPR
jgi:hypothetical protein